MVGQIEMEISFAGNLSAEQRQRLLDIAQRCPVHRMLVSQVVVHTKLLTSASRPALWGKILLAAIQSS